jgi:hypothetical protein
MTLYCYDSAGSMIKNPGGVMAACPAGQSDKRPSAKPGGGNTTVEAKPSTPPASSPAVNPPKTPPVAPRREIVVPEFDVDEGGAWMPKPLQALNIQPGGYGLAAEMNDPNNFSVEMDKTSANSMYMNYPQYRGLFNAIAKEQGGTSGSSAFGKFVTQSAYYNSIGIQVSPFELAEEYAQARGIQPLAPGDDGRKGPAAPQPIDELGIRRAMDSVSTNLIGRTLSDDEFKNYYGSYAKDFRKDPGLDYQQHETEAIKREEDYQEMQVAQKFSKAFSSVLKGAM